MKARSGLPIRQEAGGDMQASRKRCLQLHGLDPASVRRPVVLDAFELKRRRLPLERMLASAREDIHRLYAQVRSRGYAVLLAEPGGAIVERHCRDADADLFAHYGTRTGGLWLESLQGTNGIGTCIAEQRALSVHRGQHFHRCHEQLSCAGAPIFDTADRVCAVLTLASHATETADRSYELAASLATESAHAIEERLFREAHRALWILALRRRHDDEDAILLAVDADGRVAAADRAARKTLPIDGDRIAQGLALNQLWLDAESRLVRGAGEDLDLQLRCTRSGERWQGLATPPAHPARAWGPAWTGDQHVNTWFRPRVAQLACRAAVPERAHRKGGLSGTALRRVHEHVEGRLHQPLTVRELADVARLSLHHFSRAFSSSTGLSPHRYLMQQRVQRAAKLLLETARPTPEIALEAGFADQSHLIRSFVRVTGRTPQAYRRAMEGEAALPKKTAGGFNGKHVGSIPPGRGPG